MNATPRIAIGIIYGMFRAYSSIIIIPFIVHVCKCVCVIIEAFAWLLAIWLKQLSTHIQPITKSFGTITLAQGWWWGEEASGTNVTSEWSGKYYTFARESADRIIMKNEYATHTEFAYKCISVFVIVKQILTGLAVSYLIQSIITRCLFRVKEGFFCSVCAFTLRTANDDERRCWY